MSSTPVTKPSQAAAHLLLSRAAGLTLLGALLVCAAFATLLLPGATIDSLVAEDGLVEWVGALGLLAAAGCFVAAFALERGAGANRRYGTLGVAFLLFLALFAFVSAGEEISWGQRIFGIETPDAISQRNVQGETNFHNLTPIEGTGDRLFKAFLLALFVAVPVAARLSVRLRTELERLVPIVPLGIAALFVVAYGMAEIAPTLFEAAYEGDGPLQRAVTEIWESVVEVLVGVAAVATLLEIRARSRRAPR